jgi:hypothetical protein
MRTQDSWEAIGLAERLIALLRRCTIELRSAMRFRDEPDDFGQWYNGYVEVSTPSGMWTRALDVDTPTGLGISFRLIGNLSDADLGPVTSLPHGFHVLPRSSGSSAITFDPPSCRTRCWACSRRTR